MVPSVRVTNSILLSDASVKRSRKICLLFFEYVASARSKRMKTVLDEASPGCQEAPPPQAWGAGAGENKRAQQAAHPTGTPIRVPQNWG